MTAQEYFKEEMSGEPLTQDWVVEHLLKFAKLHVKAYQKILIKAGESLGDNGWDMDKYTIINAYPLDKIK